MKKRLFTSVLSVLLLIVISVFGLVGCGGNEKEDEKKITLDATVKELVVGESFTLTATTTPADAEIEWSSSDEAIITVNEGTVLAISEGVATVTAKNDTATATCEITVKAAEVQTYTVVFKNGDTELKSVEVEEGKTVSYTGVIPSKAATEQYSYTFSGWALSLDGEVVDLATVSIDADKTFYAVFTESVREYTVTWIIDGETTDETIVYGVSPEYKGTTPTKPTNGNTSYTFKGWAASLSGEVLETFPTVTGDVTYYAVFEEVTAQTKFTITWKNGEDILETDVDVEYETAPEYTGETPVKAATTEVEYVFVGWATSVGGTKLDVLPDVTADVTYYAVFEETARKYNVTWVIEGVEEVSQVAYGAVPAYNGAPVKADSVECSYKFVGWALSEDGDVLEALPEVNGEAIYYAVFDVDKVFEAPKFTDGNIMYSARTQEAFLPEGLLLGDVTVSSVVLKLADETAEVGYTKVAAYENGAWIHSALNTVTVTDAEGNVNTVNVEEQNAIVTYTSEIELSDGNKYTVMIDVYAGIIDELSDFPKFFNNEATAEGYAPVTFGYYIVTKDLGTGAEELAFTQCANTDFSKTCGFNGVLDGQGHTLRFKLTSGGLVGMVLGNGVVENLGIIFEDATNTKYGIFGYITSGAPEIRNCYIEQTNNHFSKTTTFGVMGRPSGKLRLHNTVVYGYNISMENTLGSTTLNETSSNAYVIHGRSNADTLTTIATNFTNVSNDGVENGSRELALSEIEDASAFNDAYWSKENGKLVWKGLEMVTVTWVNGEASTVKTLTKGSYLQAEALPSGTKTETEIVSYYWSDSENGEKVSFTLQSKADADATYYLVEKKSTRYYTVTWVIDGVETTTNYQYNETAAHDNPVKENDANYSYEFKGWSLSADGEIVTLGAVTADGIVYHAVFEKTAIVSAITIATPILYSSGDDQLFLPEEVDFSLDETVTITSADEATIYYQNGAWTNTFDLTAEQMQANAIGLFEVKMTKGTDIYLATVKSYAGIIDELSDLNTFFDTKKAGVADNAQVNTYGYYIVIKNLVSVDTVVTMNHTTGYGYGNSGFLGVLDGMGHTISCTLKGYLLGNELGTCTIKNISLQIKLVASGEAAGSVSGNVGILSDLCNKGTPTIENAQFVVLGEVPTYNGFSCWYIMARPKGNLVLKNVVIQADLTKAQAATDYQISANSENAFVIWARTAMVTAGQSTNFTEVSSSGAVTKDLSGFNSSYWTTTDNKPSWRAAADIVFPSIVKVNA